MSQSAFTLDIKNIRDQARKKIDQGAVTDGYEMNTREVADMLNTALATELICYLRYKQHYFMCEGMNAQAVAEEFLEHAQQEQEHADQLAERITQLGGEPEMNPSKLTGRAHAEYQPAGSVEEMIKENLIAERIAIDSYRAMINYLGEEDPTTRRMLEEILAVEEEHADDLAGLMQTRH